MTTIILTLIGILLAAAAALMTVFYGSQAFSSSNANAGAVTLVNAAENVSTAFRIFFVARHERPATISEMMPVYLAQVPNLGATGVLSDNITSSSGAYPGSFMRATNVTSSVCEKVNENTGNNSAATALAGEMPGRVGCNVNDLVFYARLGS